MKTAREWMQTPPFQRGYFDVADIVEIQSDALIGRTCDTCASWEIVKPVFSSVRTHVKGMCSQPKLNLGFNEEWKDHEYSNIDGAHGDRPMTGPKFGCIHHQPKT